MSAELERGLYALLSGATSASTRVNSRFRQGGDLPAIRYQRISSIRNLALDGPVGVTEATLQIDCMGSTYLESKTLADEVRVILHGYTGTWGTLIARLVTLGPETDHSYTDGDNQIDWVSQRYQVYTDMD